MGGKRIVVGCGPGAIDMITVRGKNIIENADIVAGSKRLLDTFVHNKKTIKVELKANYKETLNTIEKEYHEKDAVFLVSGDCLFFSMGEIVISTYGKERCEMIPGVTAMQYAASLEKKSWKNLRFFTLHGAEKRYDTSAKSITREFIKELLERENGFVFYLDPKKNINHIKEMINGLDVQSHEFTLVSNASLENEKCQTIDLTSREELEEESLSVLIARKI